MKSSYGRRSRLVPSIGLLGLSVLLGGVGSGCLNTDPPDLTYNELNASGEVFRVFCRRVAKDSYPLEVEGDRFYPICDGFEPDGVTPRDAEEETAPELRALLRRRPEIMASLDRLFGDDPTDQGVTFEKGELSGFLQALVPLYDKPNETIPTATRGIAQLLEQLVDPNDARASKVLDTVARLVQRKGYRTPDRNLGAVRALFTYPGLDTLAQKLLPVISAQGAAHDQWVAVLNAAGLELADEPVPVADLDDTTLHTALDLVLKVDPTQKSGNVGPAVVLQRAKGSGDALATDGAGSNLATPFPVVDEDDNNAPRDATGLALSGGKPAYQTFDASQTLLAALMRETSLLIRRGDADRSPLENFAHGLKPLLGPQIARSETIGKNDYKFTGPDVDHSPLMDLAHASALLARYPETDALLKTLDALIRDHESEATGFDFASMAIADMSKDPKYDGAKLLDNHDFWDDLIAAGERMNKRPGLFDALIRSFLEPGAGAQGKLFAAWMRYKDELSYPNSPITPSGAKGAFSDKEAADLNTQVVGPFAQRVDRGSPDVGMNRSIWQRTMSLINALNGVKVCNKMGALLSVPGTGIGDLNFPAGSSATGYSLCDLIEYQDAVEIYSRSVIGGPGFAIKDSFASVLAVLGSLTGISGNVGQITEQNS
ncbi:MAG: hypothetical protein JWN04_3929, partial [Myxococcaceae bacterium]|nr:hypothetical protein [Myxococcaceae bacterium]